jgi:tetratricopeptide (TPR) repeat protein
MQTAADRKWMIKSENKILGPYSYDQIEDLLRKKQISLIDEVRDTDTRWMYVRESEPLKMIVDEIRAELASTDDHTKTYQTRTAQVTKTGTKTQELVMAEKTKFEMPSFTNVTVEDAEYTEEAPAAALKRLKPAPPVSKTKTVQYVSNADPVVHSKIRERSKLTLMVLISILLGVIVVAGGSHFYQQQGKKKQEQKAIAQIRKYSLYGLEGKVVEIFGNMSSEVQRQVLPELIPMIPKLDSVGYINGAQTINNLKSNPGVSDQRKALLDIVQFIQSLQDQDLKKARESLIRAKDLDPTSELIKENDAILSYYEGRYDQATKIYSDLYNTVSKGRWLFGWAVSELSKLTINTETESMLNHEIERYTEKNADYKKELLLINMLLDKRTNREEKFNRDFQNYVAMPLNFRQRFQVPLSVFSGFYSTFTLRSVFEKLKPFLTARDKIIAEVHMKLELGEISAAQALYTSYQSLIEDPADLANLRLQLDYALKDYTAVVTQEKTLNVSKLNIASHYVLLLSKQKLNTQATSLIDDGISTHSNFIRSEKNILGLWAQLVTMEPSKRMMFVQSNSGAGEDFIPFLEIKGSVE